MLIYAIMCTKTQTAQMAGHHAATLMVPPFKNCKLTYIVKIFRGAFLDAYFSHRRGCLRVMEILFIFNLKNNMCGTKFNYFLIWYCNRF